MVFVHVMVKKVFLFAVYHESCDTQLFIKYLTQKSNVVGEGRDPMMESPAEVSPEQLRELGIALKK